MKYNHAVLNDNKIVKLYLDFTGTWYFAGHCWYYIWDERIPYSYKINYFIKLTSKLRKIT